MSAPAWLAWATWFLVEAAVACAPARAEEASAPGRLSPNDERRLVLMLIELDLAQTACGFPVDRARLEGYLTARGTSREALYGRPMSAEVQAGLQDLVAGFKASPLGACEAAARRFGPEGETPGLLRRAGL